MLFSVYLVWFKEKISWQFICVFKVSITLLITENLLHLLIVVTAGMLEAWGRGADFGLAFTTRPPPSHIFGPHVETRPPDFQTLQHTWSEHTMYRVIHIKCWKKSRLKCRITRTHAGPNQSRDRDQERN